MTSLSYIQRVEKGSRVLELEINKQKKKNNDNRSTKHPTIN